MKTNTNWKLINTRFIILEHLQGIEERARGDFSRAINGQPVTIYEINHTI